MCALFVIYRVMLCGVCLCLFVLVCDAFKRVLFDCDLLCDGVWSVVCVGLCLCACWFHVFV